MQRALKTHEQRTKEEMKRVLNCGFYDSPLKLDWVPHLQALTALLVGALGRCWTRTASARRRSCRRSAALTASSCRC